MRRTEPMAGPTRRLLRLGLLAALALPACSDDDAAGNNSTDGNNHNAYGCADGAMRCQGTVIETCQQGWVAGVDCADQGELCVEESAVASCEPPPPCTDGATRCAGGTVEACAQGAWSSALHCPDAGQVCRTDGTTGIAGCAALAWVHLPVEIEDPVMVGSSLMVPIDGVSFDLDPAAELFVTSFGRDLDTPTLTHLWTVDGVTGTHAKQTLSGAVFPTWESFCVGGEDWCQLIGFDAQLGDWVVLGPRTESAMRVSTAWTASLAAVSGPQPPDSWINHNHRFDWTSRQLFLYGATGPAGFSDTVYVFDLDNHVWSEAVSGLPQVDDNCLAFDSGSGTLYSFGGRETNDGGNSTQTLATYAAIDVVGGTHTTHALPVELGPRRALACAYDGGRDVIYVFAGSLINDRWNEALNEYHNDLWVFDPTDQSWTRILDDTESGTLLPPDSYGDQSFEGYPEGPNFGQNRGYLHHDAVNDRLVIVGAVPIFTHEQLYHLALDGVEQLL